MILVKIFCVLAIGWICWRFCAYGEYKKTYEANKVQKVTLVGIVLFFILLLNSRPIYTCNYLDSDYDIYNKYLVDAILAGKVNIDLEPSEELKELENPYDPDAREDIEYSFDTAYYNGKYYVYFGVVPALLLFVPFKLITGYYLDTYIGAKIFVILSVIINVLLTIEITKRWFKKTPFNLMVLFIISGLISGLYSWISWRLWVYELTLISGFFFVQLGILLMLKATKEKERTNLKYVFFSCLSMALAVGCRPTLVLSSALLLPFLYTIIKNASKEKLIKTLAIIIIPYLLVAIPMMIYNYVRFGSILDFGANYQLTIVDVTSLSDRYKDLPRGLYQYFIQPIKVSKEFPYINIDRSTEGFTENYCNCGMIGGIFFINLLLISCFLVFKYYKKTDDKILKCLMILLPIVGLVLGIVTVIMGASIQRYVVDFFWMFTFLSMIIWLLMYENEENEQNKKWIFRSILTLVILSIIINFFGTYINSELNILEEYHPKGYEVLESVFS